MPGYWRDLRNRQTQPYSGPNPIQARWRHPDDPRIRREKSFATKRQAREWLAEQDTDSKRGVWTDPHAGRETIAAIAQAWQESMRHQIGPKTREGYASILSAHILPAFGPRRVSGIDAADVQRFANELLNRRSPKTVRNVVVVLDALLDFAVVRKFIAVNPCTSVRLRTFKRQRKITPLPHKMLAALADAMPTAQDRAAVLIAGYCGLRAGEVWALRNDDVGIRRLRVDEKITEASVAGDTDYTILPGGQAIGPTKTYTDAPVAMPEFVAEALAGIIDAKADPESFIFSDSMGGPIRQSNWYLRTYKPTLLATLPAEYHGFTFHDLRHTCAAYMIEAGFHPKVIQQQMRHSSIQTTMDVYGHLFEDGLDAVAAAMDEGYRARRQDSPSSVARIRP